MTLHNGMILSSINFHSFVLGFSKMPHTRGDVFFSCKPMIIP